MIKQILKRISERLKRKGIEVNVSVKIGTNNETIRNIKKPIYFEKEDK